MVNTKFALFWYILFLVQWVQSPCYAQDEGRLVLVEERLQALIDNGIELNRPVTISLNGSIQELVGFLAESTNLNIAIDPNITTRVSVTFTQVQIRDILLYLCDTYQLDLRPTGNIVQLIAYRPPPKPVIVREPGVSFNTASGLLTLSLRGDTLENVLRKIVELTGRNVIADPLVRDARMRGYISELSFDPALKQLADGNNLVLEQTPDYYIFKLPQDENQFGENIDSEKDNTRTSNISIKKIGAEQINIKATDVPILDIIAAAAKELNADYYVLPEVVERESPASSTGRRPTTSDIRQSSSTGAQIQSGLSTLQLKDVTFRGLLAHLCKNSDYTFEERGGIFIIGQRVAETLRASKMVQLQYRSARGIIDLIPQRMRTGVTIDTLYELNSLLLSGSENNIAEVTTFLNSVDKLVPVVMIELMIIDVQSGKLDEYGIEAGVVKGGKQPGGSIVSGDENDGGVNFTFSPQAINRVLDLLSGRGFINLGRVTNDFYLSLKALQEDGLVDIKSTPKLSTLNSHDAILSIGQKRYYQEQQFNYPGLDRPIPVQANLFKEVEANLFININPIVSGDEQVTLNVQFEQSEFVGDPGPLAPPPQVSRKFESIIRVRNGEMIVLGGLEREAVSKLKRGVPWVNRIPVLGWLFGKHRKSNQKEKLLIFVKPTIVN